MGILTIPIGVSVLVGSAQVRKTARVSYGRNSKCDVGPVYKRSSICTVPFEVSETIPAPAYLYYGLTDFFQNARKYARSRSDRQLRGLDPRNKYDIMYCEPILYEEGTSRGRNGFNDSEFIIPCGLTAWSQFNDTFKLCRDKQCDDPVRLRKEGIAWDSDVNTRYQPGKPPLFTSEINNRLRDQDFMNWMRLSTLSDFNKLYRIIDTDLPPGTYYMNINSSFPVSSYKGDKLFQISSMKWFGDQNYFLGIVYIVVGMLALLIGSLLLVRQTLKPRLPVAQDPDRMLRELAKLNMNSVQNTSRSSAS